MKVLHVPPYNYVHIKDKSENTIFMYEGPLTYVLQSHEEVILDVTPMIKIPPNKYIRIANPVIRDVNSDVVMEEGFTQAKLLFGDEEIRTYESYPDPFPLYPGEIISENLKDAVILSDLNSVKLFALRDFYCDRLNREINTGETYIIKGPGVYFGRVEDEVIEFSSASIVSPNTALLLKAERDLVDSSGVDRKNGDMWLVRELGPYFLGPYEILIDAVRGKIINDKQALRIEAKNSFVDLYGVSRSAGEIWLITSDISSTHIEDVHETILDMKDKIVLNRWQYCIILDPVEFDETNENKKYMRKAVNQFGKKILRRGEASFFLMPGERLIDNKIHENIILASDQALLVKAIENYEDEYGKHLAGERWMIYGSRNFVPPIEIEIIEIRNTIPMDDSEGVYVRDIFTGEIKMVTGTTYMLKAHEEFWKKELPAEVEFIIQSESHSYSPQMDSLKSIRKRDPTRIVTYCIPHNSVVQIFDYKEKLNRIEFGPALIKLGPYEQFTLKSLSGSDPKEENYIKSIIIRLGPDFFADTVEVETSDHARLRLKLNYSWKFDFDRNKEDEIQKIFQIKDFIGDSCKAIASRVRGVVSSVTFDAFHKDSSNIVQTGVFGLTADGKLKKPLRFKANNLIINNIDIQSLEPIDSKTREILDKSMILSMKTNIQIQESEAKHREEIANQEAKGHVERNKIVDETELEKTQLDLFRSINENIDIKTTGLAESFAKAKCSDNEIKSEAELERIKNELEADKKFQISQLSLKRKNYDEEIRQLKRISELEVEKVTMLADSTQNKLKIMIEALGRETLVQMAKAGPESQSKILKGLGIKSMIITDGKNPINLFNTANGLMGMMPNINN
jgi:major vault protein